MRILVLATILITVSSVASAQNQPMRMVKEHDFGGKDNDTIISHKFLERENQLLLVGRKSIRRIDAATGAELVSRAPEMEALEEDSPRVISPDNKHMLVAGNLSFYGPHNQKKRTASIWDPKTAKQLAVLDLRLPVNTAQWSRSGRTLVTISNLGETDAKR